MKIFRPSFIHLGVLIFLFTNISLLKAANYYWVGGSGNWSEISHWATSSGGSTLHTVIPSHNDNVIFDGNSGFTPTSRTVIVDGIANCLDMTWSGVQNNPTITSDSNNYNAVLNIYGSLTTQQNMYFTVYNTNFLATQPDKIIATNSLVLGVDADNQPFYITLNFTGSGGWIFQDDFLGKNVSLNINKGSLNTNNKNFQLNKFNVSIDATSLVSINLGTSTIRLNGWIGSWDINASWDANPNNLNFNAGTSTLIFESPVSSFYSRLDGLQYNQIIFDNSSMGSYSNDPGIISNVVSAPKTKIKKLIAHTDMKFLYGYSWETHDNVSIDEWVLSAGKKYAFEFGKPVTVLQSITIDGATEGCTNFTQLKSTESGKQVQLHIPSGATLNSLMVNDINFVNAPITTSNSLDLGNNANITFTSPPVGNTLYWIGGGGNWADSQHWSTTSGGTASSGCIPSAVDHVIFDANSGFTPGNNKVIIPQGHSFCKNMTWQGAPENPIIDGTGDSPGFVKGTLNIFGSLQLQTGMTYNVPFTYFKSSEPGKTITSNNVVLGSSLIANDYGAIYFEGNGGGWIFQDKFQTPYKVNFNQGNLNTAGYAVDAKAFITPNINDNIGISTISLSLGSSTIRIKENWYYSGANLDAGTSHIIFYGGGQYGNSLYDRINGHQYYNITMSEPLIKGSIGGSILSANNVLMKGDGNIADKWTINNLTLSAGKTYTFPITWDGNGLTINQSFTAKGDACNGMIKLRDDYNNYSGGASKLFFAQGSIVQIERASIQKIAVTGANTIDVANSQDLGNNSGINFIGTMTPKTLYWVNGGGDWNNSSHWSFTSGGTPDPNDCQLPDALTNVVFDANSGFTPTSNTVSMPSSGAYVKDMTWINAPNNPIISSPANTYQGYEMNIYGSITLQNNMQYFVNNTYFRSQEMGNTITTNGAVLKVNSNDTNFTSNFIFDSVGGWILQDDLTIGYIGLLGGTFDTNGNTIRCESINSGSSGSVSYPVTIYLRNSDIYTNGGIGLKSSAQLPTILHAGTSRIFINDQAFMTSGLMVYSQDEFVFNEITFTNPQTYYLYIFGNIKAKSVTAMGNLYFGQEYQASNHLKIDHLTLTAGKTYTFATDKTVQVNNAVYLSGNPCNVTYIQSSNPGAQANLNILAGNTNFDFINIKDINATGSYQLLNIGGHSIDNGNNSNMTFAPATDDAILGLGENLNNFITPITLNTDGFMPNPTTTFLWSDNSTASTLLVKEPGTYSVKVTYGDGCVVNSSITLTAPPCTKPGQIQLYNGNIVGCRKDGFRKLTEDTEITSVVNPLSTDGLFKSVPDGVVGREFGKYYRFQNTVNQAILGTLPNKTLEIGKIVYDNDTDHFYEATSTGWVRIDN